MMTTKELREEFWMLVKGILQDERVDTDEARVIKRWLEEHRIGTTFDFAIEKLGKQLEDGYIDRFESHEICSALGDVLRTLRKMEAEQA